MPEPACMKRIAHRPHQHLYVESMHFLRRYYVISAFCKQQSTVQPVALEKFLNRLVVHRRLSPDVNLASFSRGNTKTAWETCTNCYYFNSCSRPYYLGYNMIRCTNACVSAFTPQTRKRAALIATAASSAATAQKAVARLLNCASQPMAAGPSRMPA
jgi:hypothetical protein